MKRRGVLGFLGGAVVSGPSMAKAAVASGLEALSVGQAAGLIGVGTYPFADNPAPIDSLHPSDPAHWAQRSLADFMGATAEELAEQRLRTDVHQLDPDLAANRSFSLSAKMSIQRDRNFQRNREQQKTYILRDIKQAMKNWAGRL